MTWLFIAFKNTLYYRTRVFSSVLIMATGITALLLGGGFMLSTYDALQEISIRNEGHIIVLGKNSVNSHKGSNQQFTLDNWITLRENLLDHESVVRVLPRVGYSGLLINDKNTNVFFGIGVDAEREFQAHGPFLRIVEGDILDPFLESGNMPEILIGSELASSLNTSVGQVLTIVARRHQNNSIKTQVKVMGLFKTGTPEIDETTAYTSLSTVEQLFGTSKISSLSIYLQNKSDIPMMRQILKKIDDELIVRTWEQRADLYHKVKALYDRIFSVMGFIILVVVFLSVYNTVSMSIFQRHKEIATLSVMGTLPRIIFVNFILETLIVGLISLAIGMIVALTLTHLFNGAQWMMPAPPGKSEGYPFYIYSSFKLYLSVGASVIFIALIANLISSIKALKINIVKALAN